MCLSCTTQRKNAMQVDRCDSCFGYWLDAGEMDKALRRRRKKGETSESQLRVVLRAVADWFAIPFAHTIPNS